MHKNKIIELLAAKESNKIHTFWSINCDSKIEPNPQVTLATRTSSTPTLTKCNTPITTFFATK